MLEKPIYYKGYKLLYKTPTEWEEFGLLNPHIPEKFWDSPVISTGSVSTQLQDFVKKQRSRQGSNMLQRTMIRSQRDLRIQAALEEERLTREAAGLRTFQNQTRIKQLISESRTLNSHGKKNEREQSILRNTLRRVRAVGASMTTLGLYFWFYCIQLAFGILFIVIGYLTSTWIGWASSFFYDTGSISTIGWAVCSIISLAFMFIAIVSLVTVRAKVGSGLTMLMFLIGIAGSIAPYFNLLPWPAFFMATAVANQK